MPYSFHTVCEDVGLFFYNNFIACLLFIVVIHTHTHIYCWHKWKFRKSKCKQKHSQKEWYEREGAHKWTTKICYAKLKFRFYALKCISVGLYVYDPRSNFRMLHAFCRYNFFFLIFFFDIVYASIGFWSFTLSLSFFAFTFWYCLFIHSINFCLIRRSPLPSLKMMKASQYRNPFSQCHKFFDSIKCLIHKNSMRMHV